VCNQNGASAPVIIQHNQWRHEDDSEFYIYLIGVRASVWSILSYSVVILAISTPETFSGVWCQKEEEEEEE